MRKICAFELENNTEKNVFLNIAAEIARNDRKVLLLDFRRVKEKQRFGDLDPKKNAYNCLNEHLNIKNNIQELEKNLFIVPGSPDIEKAEFNIYYELFRRTFFEKKLNDLEYDYVILLLSPVIGEITMNALNYAEETISIIECSTKGYDFQEKINRFLHHFKRYYGKNLFFSRIIPFFDDDLDVKSYNLFTSEFTNLLVTPPMPISSYNPHFKRTLKAISQLVIDDEQKFDTKYNKLDKQLKIDEYYNIQTEKKEVPLSKFTVKVEKFKNN